MVFKKQKTIFALSSAEGVAGISVIRISGPKCKYILNKICKINDLKSRYFKYTNFLDSENKLIDSGVVIFLQSPKSFTGEDMLEFHLHGSIAGIKKMFNELVKIRDVSVAEAGEFSKRAFINKKNDLMGLEGLKQFIESETEAERQVAINQSLGSTKKIFEKWLKSLIEIYSLIDANIEFSEEDTAINETDIFQKIKRLSHEIKKSIDFSLRFKQLKSGLNVTIIGFPNAGKSSIFNCLNNEERSIVTSMEGTTRDVVSSINDFYGIKVNLFDTAGIRNSKSLIEKIGIKKTFEISRESNKLILVLSPDNYESRSMLFLKKLLKKKKDIIIIFNKSDLKISKNQKKKWESLMPDLVQYPSIKFSCKEENLNNSNYRKLTKFISNNLLGDKHLYKKFIFGEMRQVNHLKDCFHHLTLATKHEKSLELASDEIKLALSDLEKLSGKIDEDRKLDYIFKNFCIGK